MFGNDNGVPEAVTRWLELLRGRDDHEWFGPLIVLNIQEDGNVRSTVRTRVIQRVGESEPQTVEDAVALFDDIVRDLSIYDYSSLENDLNRRAMPFDEVGRVVTREDFIRHLLSEELRYVAFEPDFRIPENVKLEGVIHNRQVFAAPLNDLLDEKGAPENPDAIRDRLGLDSPGFVQGARFVILQYGKEALPSEYCWRPTVLDARSNAAFLPSEPEAPHGYTQHLKTGEPEVAEVVHEPFPASLVHGYIECRPLETDPPRDYRKKRQGEEP